MRTKLLILGGVLAAGIGIHHSGHCPLMDAKNAISRHVHGAPANQVASAAGANSGTSGTSGTQATETATTVSAAVGQ